jgi:hypothetical protein
MAEGPSVLDRSLQRDCFQDPESSIDARISAGGLRAWHPEVVHRLAAIAVLALALAGTGTAATGASLRLATMKPLVVDGRQFKPQERVLLKLTAGRTGIVRHALASSTGTFRASFGPVTLGSCSGFAVRAIGSGGSVALLKRTPLPACMPE